LRLLALSHAAVLPPFLTCPCRGALFACLKEQLPALNYTAQLSAWLDAFPADQVMLLQVSKQFMLCSTRCGNPSHA
jgi:hypothetical protein